MRYLTFAAAIALCGIAQAKELVPASGLPFCSSKAEMQELLRKSLDKNWDPPGNLDCLFLKAGLEMETVREIKGISPVGQVKEVKVFMPGQNRSVSGFIFVMQPR
ncbi:hypothetical protein [Microvirga sp. KLBC 81]|uniref:hypothetical protein n=1 Tax=Microvirga sp. KLBC 81 TaxID=1862707 RepID=UPI0010582494|nr:hypothetical protein [Microvirga sp. KLBC 81]